MEAKWSSLVSYGMSLEALQDFLPLDLTLDVKTVRYDTLKVAKRLETELGEEQPGFIDGDPRDWALLPPPDGTFTVGIDGGYVRHWLDKKHNFEVIVGKSTLSFGAADDTKSPSHRRLGFVQTLEALVGFQGLMLTCASETCKALIRPLKNNDFKEAAGCKKRVIRYCYIHVPGIQ
jgi:hypothetical protein